MKKPYCIFETMVEAPWISLEQKLSHFTAALRVILTKYPKVSNLLQGPPEVAAGLEAASVGVNVYVANGLLDPDAETQ